MKRLLSTLILASTLLCAQAPQIADTVLFKDTRTAVNSALTTLHNSKAGTGTCPANQYAIQTSTSGVVCASLTNGQIVAGLGFTPVNTTDARLSDARTPTNHAGNHGTGGIDPVTPASIGAEPVDAKIMRTDVAGNLTVGSTVLDVGPEGVCNASLRGHIVTTLGSGGVADQRRVCTKAADGSYSWTALGSGSGSTGVPYTGATGPVDLGSNTITASQFITTAGGSNSGVTCWNGLTSGRICTSVGDVAGTDVVYIYPSTWGGGGTQFLSDSGAVTCPTLPAGSPTVCHQLVWANPVSAGTTLPATCAVGTQFILTAQYSGSGFNYYPAVFTCLSTNKWIAGLDGTTTGSRAMFPPSGGDFPGWGQLTAAVPSITQPVYYQFTVRDTFAPTQWSVKIGTASAGNYIGANLYDASCNRIGPATTTGAATTGDNYPTGALNMTLGPGTYYLALWASSLTPTFNVLGDSTQAGSQLSVLNSHTSVKRIATGANTASQTAGTITWPSACGALTAYYTNGPIMVMLHN